MQMSKKDYNKYAQSKAPKSHTLRDTLLAWLVGGGICVLGQGIIDFGKNRGMEEANAATFAAVILIVLGGVLTAFGLYAKLAKWAGGGTLIPITGFANAMVAPAMEFQTEGLIVGTGAKMFTITGPVLVYGILASAIYGLVLQILG